MVSIKIQSFGKNLRFPKKKKRIQNMYDLKNTKFQKRRKPWKNMQKIRMLQEKNREIVRKICGNYGYLKPHFFLAEKGKKKICERKLRKFQQRIRKVHGERNMENMGENTENAEKYRKYKEKNTDRIFAPPAPPVAQMHSLCL